jgi:hypothetical protein
LTAKILFAIKSFYNSYIQKYFLSYIGGIIIVITFSFNSLLFRE